MRFVYITLLLFLSYIISCFGQTSTTFNEDRATTTTTDMESTPSSSLKSTSSNATMTSTSTDKTSSGTQTSYSPSPTSFVFTHFPVHPMRTGSSSSAMSSARPSQSAPFPDDTIGKYGRLHINKAMYVSPPHSLKYGLLLVCLVFIL